jgi:hypothetical protein
MPQTLWNLLLLRTRRARKGIEKIVRCLESEFTEETLELLLKGMSLVFAVSEKYRKNIEGFVGRYVFRSEDESFVVSAAFDKGKMSVRKGELADPNIRVYFSNSHALLNFIFSPKPDVLSAILNQEVTPDGNLNYLYKFAYMANHLRLKGIELL